MEFIDNHQIRTFKAGGHIFSEDGETAYIGSWKGERFARVYRYHKPHPRCKLLRAEVVLRGDYAKQAMNLVLSEGEVMASFIAHEAFKWSHPVWQPDQISQSRIKSQRSDKEQTGTIRWLRGDVITAILSAHNNGLFDAVRWFEEDVRPRLPKG
jgi:DNA relaxase NicK